MLIFLNGRGAQTHAADDGAAIGVAAGHAARGHGVLRRGQSELMRPVEPAAFDRGR